MAYLVGEAIETAEQQEAARLRARIVALGHEALNEAEKMMVYSTPVIKLQLMRTVIPNLIKVLERTQQDGEMIELKRQFDAFRKEMSEGVGEIMPEVNPGTSIMGGGEDPELLPHHQAVKGDRQERGTDPVRT